ncbi:hypothetical protein [Mycobacterium ostraviense]|nr:hypothetical protein [Mycobacterium ostraviense]
MRRPAPHRQARKDTDEIVATWTDLLVFVMVIVGAVGITMSSS